jgi:hypothetical protein
MNETINILHQRHEDLFVPINVKNNLREESSSTKPSFMEEVKEFYSTAEAYLTKWMATLSNLNVFSWMLLTDVPSWTSIEESCQYLNEKGIDVNDSLLHNQFNNIMTDN